MRHAGSESLTPSEETQMYGGIYKHIRHPQTVGEFPTFVAIAFILNSWFLVIITALFIVIYIPIMIYYGIVSYLSYFYFEDSLGLMDFPEELPAEGEDFELSDFTLNQRVFMFVMFGLPAIFINIIFSIFNFSDIIMVNIHFS